MSNEVELRELGFVGFLALEELKRNLTAMPTGSGVYAVLYSRSDKPAFLTVSTGGHHKGKDPSVSVAELDSRWVDGPTVVYYGKASASSPSRGLRTRFGEFLKFGAGKPVGHWGGRLTWQLPDTGDLIVCWKETPDSDPRAMEREMIADFANRFGKRPFANIAA